MASDPKDAPTEFRFSFTYNGKKVDVRRGIRWDMRRDVWIDFEGKRQHLGRPKLGDANRGEVKRFICKVLDDRQKQQQR